MILQPDGQIVTFAVDPDIAKATTGTNYQADAVRLLGPMNTVGGRRDAAERAILSSWRARLRFVAANLFFHLESNRMLWRSILPQRHFRRQFHRRQRFAEKHGCCQPEKKNGPCSDAGIVVTHLVRCHTMFLECSYRLRTYNAHPLRYSRRMNWSASGQFVAFTFSASHWSFSPVR